jgi:steroid 5-alpha reductase family enzyme
MSVQLLCFIVSQPLLTAQTAGPDWFTLQDVIGSLLWLVGFLFEAVGDLQLARFKSNPQNKGMNYVYLFSFELLAL